MGPRVGTVEQILARIAGREWGIVTRAELLEAGVTDMEIKRRVSKGGLFPEFRGVYRVGHRAPSLEARYLAAVRACGEVAFLSGPAAGFLLGIVGGSAPPPQVTAPTARRLPGVVTHRARSIDPRDVTAWCGIPVTSVARTLVDLAASFSVEALARACHEAEIRHALTPDHVEEVLERRPTTKGAKKLRAVLHGDAKVTLSKLERRFLDLLEEAGLPLPQTNRPAGGYRVDCRWPQHRLTVELDSYRYHRSRHAFEQDRRREREAYARGDGFRRFTWGDVFEHAPALKSELRSALRASVPSSGS